MGNTTASLARPSVVRVFDVVSRVYDIGFVQRIGYRPNHDAVLAELRRCGAQRILDVGCGTGILASRIAEQLRAESVLGCDPSEGMLAKARARSRSVRWLQGSAERLPLEDGAVDAVVCTEAFHFFDQPRALREFHRVLEPEGHLIVAVITPAIPTLRFTAGRAASWPTRGQMREMMRSAGFRVESQRPVRPLLGPLSPGVATVGSREGG